jgi:hypothetical protein
LFWLDILTTVSRAKAKTRTTVCLGNLRQIGIAIELYRQDSRNGFFPPSTVMDLDGKMKGTSLTLGGQDPAPPFRSVYPAARARPLYSYLKASEVFRCSEDQGQRILVCVPAGPRPQKPSNCLTTGASYHYNASLPTTLVGGGFQLGYAGGLALQSDSWLQTNPLFPYEETKEWMWYKRATLGGF